MKNNLNKFSNQELVDELISRGDKFVTSMESVSTPSVFLELSFDDIYEITSGDEEVTEEFFDEHFDEVYDSVDWDDVRFKALIYVIDFISLTLRNKCNGFNPYNNKIWELDIN